MGDTNRDASYKKGIWLGVGVAGLAHALIMLGLFFLTDFGAVPFMIIGIVQLVYLGPLSLLVLLNKPYGKAMSVGIWYAAGITFLLNAACFGIVLVVVANKDF
ncbi:hypothetical protein [Tumebacillus permanentifrigoris]|uniref:Uncharacterized protein n=1 Tax=Tumebacillus permanentifrigoris TaxID=378543 RepID=A0A316D4A5_9BACL|nr:hypothetical protein [Tumebacillus permanentifrigoris]PWK07001.1 hypothetical protein C7459_11871 [Tumebacillus permanentifrigoris]